MKAATIPEIKQELTTEKQAALVTLCLRLAKFKKENKELLTYLLFEANDEKGFIEHVKNEIDEQFNGINQGHLYYAKKSLRKILRLINKYCRYSGSNETETELRLYFCSVLNNSSIPLHSDKTIKKLYHTQLTKVKSLVARMHEDLQYDFKRTLRELE